MPVLISLEEKNLDFILRCLAMTVIKLLVSAHLALRKRSIYVSSHHHPVKISAVPFFPKLVDHNRQIIKK